MSEASTGPPAPKEPIDPPADMTDEPVDADQPGLPDGPDGSVDAVLDRDHPFG